MVLSSADIFFFKFSLFVIVFFFFFFREFSRVSISLDPDHACWA